MKAIIEKMLECLLAFLPFLSKRSKKKVEKMKEFSELVREQYGFLVGQLEKVLQDYFGLSARVKEMHTEIFSLKAELAKDLPLHAGELRQAAGGGRHCGCVKISPLQAGRLAGAELFFVLYGGSGFFYTGVCCVFPMKRSIFAPIYINNNDV